LPRKKSTIAVKSRKLAKFSTLFAYLTKFVACNQTIKLHGLIRYPESACVMEQQATKMFNITHKQRINLLPTHSE